MPNTKEEETISTVYEGIAAICENIQRVIIGKGEAIDLVLSTLLAGGHVLLEDVPGTGKTMLAKALARSIQSGYTRVQFTPDLLPSDITGLNVYNPKDGEFVFRRGALFTNILLADEINRATPRTQSGLLESMEERQITVDGITYPLSLPYFVIATQNPVETQGTYPLPEAQLDRFMIRLSLGYPTMQESVHIMKSRLGDDPLKDINPVLDGSTIVDMQRAARDIFIHEALLTYILELAEGTRSHSGIALGVSTRGCIALMNLSRAYAAVKGRGYVIPDDIRMLAPYVFAHRLVLRAAGQQDREQAESLLSGIIAETTVPVEKWD